MKNFAVLMLIDVDINRIDSKLYIQSKDQHWKYIKKKKKSIPEWKTEK